MLTFLTILVSLFFALELFNAYRSVLTLQWPRVEGTLEHWNFEQTDNGDSVSVAPKNIEYSYSVGKTSYLGKKVGFGFPRNIQFDYLERTVTEVFRNAPSVGVHYNPRRPDEAVLATGFRSYHGVKILGFGFITLWLLFALRAAA